MIAKQKVQDSFFLLWLEGAVSNLKANIGYLPAYFAVKEAEENLAKAAKAAENEATTAEADIIDTVGNVVTEDVPDVSISNQVWNEETMRFENTTPYGEFDTDYENDPVIGATSYKGNPIGFNFTLTDDQLDNFLDDSLVALRCKDKDEAHLFKYAMLTILFYTQKIRNSQLRDRCETVDDIVLCNSIYKFFTWSKIYVSYNAYELSEFMTRRQILKVLMYLNQKSMFDVDSVFAACLRKAQEENAKEEKKIKGNNGERPVSGDEIITPIVFNNAYLSSVDLLSGNVPEPEILPSLKKKIINKISSLTGIDTDKNRKTGLFIEVRGRVDPNNPKSCADIGQAVVNIKDHQTGYIQKQLILDLDTITATGVNVITRAVDPDGNMHYVYVSLEKDPEIVKNIFTCQGEYIINARTEEGKREYDKVIKKMLPNPTVYTYYDFSRMHKEIAGLTEKQAERFCNLLMNVVKQPWHNLGIASMGAPFRFRFRDFKAYNEFTLISDKDVRVQDSNWMARPIWNPLGKLYIDKPGVSSDDKLIVKVKGNEFTVTLNGKEIDWQNGNS